MYTLPATTALGLRGWPERDLCASVHAGDDAAYRQQPVLNNSWIGHPMSFRNLKRGLVGLGLKAPMHLNFNITQLREILPALSGFVAAAAIDGGCDIGGAYEPGAPTDSTSPIPNKPNQTPPCPSACGDSLLWKVGIHFQAEM